MTWVGGWVGVVNSQTDRQVVKGGMGRGGELFSRDENNQQQTGTQSTHKHKNQNRKKDSHPSMPAAAR